MTLAEVVPRILARPTALTVRGLTIDVRTQTGVLHAVRGLSFSVAQGETIAIIGESGSGKSATIRGILGLARPPKFTVTADEIRFRDIDLNRLPEPEMRRLRGRELALVSQNALSALDPCFSVGYHLSEVLRNGGVRKRRVIETRSIELLERVGLPEPRQALRRYPHELSGGMRQRVEIALAVALQPSILFADEPTTSLDVTIQAQILRLLQSLCRELGMSLVLVTHDMGVVASVAERVVVMYAGRVVEELDVHTAFTRPAHPYTIGLLASTPGYGADIVPIPGRRPSPFDLPAGCAFNPRCHAAMDTCRTIDPQPRLIESHHAIACHFPQLEGPDVRR